jgi:transposase
VCVDLIRIEAYAGSHFLGKALRKQGHEVRLMPAQYVKPFVKTNKNDFIYAEAIAEAVGGPPCALCRSSATSSSTCSLCTGCVNFGLWDAPQE